MGIHLIIHYCGDSRAGRLAEYNECVGRNLTNPYIEKIHNLGIESVPIPLEFSSDPKWHNHFINHRMTFQDVFDYANSNLEGLMVGVCNLDIFLDPESKWDLAENLLRTRNVVLCQSRVEFQDDQTKYLDPSFARLAMANAQDAWFFIPKIEVKNINFEIGTIGCDNALADRLKKSGKIPVNMASRFRIFHYDLFRGKQGATTNLIHKKESLELGTVYSRFPEREGCYLTPDFDMVQSIDELIKQLNVDPIRKYQIISDIMSEYIRIQN